jgi:hypothetical protein
MFFQPEDLSAGYTVAEVEKLFFLRRNLGDFSADEKRQLIEKLNHIGLAQIRLDTWTIDELQVRVLQLLECLQSIEAAVEIFGLDVGTEIPKDFATYSQFIWDAFSPEQRARLRDHHDAALRIVRQCETLDIAQRAAALRRVLSHNLQLRGMTMRDVRLRDDRNAVGVDVPVAAITTSDDDQVIRRLCELTRYATIARSVFGDMFESVFVVETDDTGAPCQLAGELTGRDLDEYADEKAGLIDLINDAKWWLNRQRLGIQVGFAALTQAENSQAAAPLPRKPRA